MMPSQRQRSGTLRGITLLLIAVLLPVCVYGETVFKCTDAEGRTLYQTKRCEDARQVEEKNINPNYNVIKQDTGDAPAAAPAAPVKPEAPKKVPAKRRD